MASQQSTYIAVRDDASCISINEKNFILTNSANNVRLDGRKHNERRNVQIQLTRGENLSTCTILFGIATRVTCTITADLITPPNVDRPNEGIISYSIDISPSASTTYRMATPIGTTGSSTSSNTILPDRNQKLQCNHIIRTIERIVRDIIDVETLCVVVNEYVWKLNINITVLDAYGNILDASILSTIAALRHYRKPIVDTTTTSNNIPIIISSTRKQPTPLPLHHTPITITYALLIPIKNDTNDTITTTTNNETTTSTTNNNNTKTIILVDPNQREELCQTGSITIAMNIHCEICLLDFSGGCELSLDDIRYCHKQASTIHIPALCQQLEQTLIKADEQALQEQLHTIQKEQQATTLPPLILPEFDADEDNNNNEPDDNYKNVPYLQQQQKQPIDNGDIHSQYDKEEDEMYRKQALDYNLGHVPSKIRNDDDDKKGNDKPKKNNNLLLQAMLQSVQQDDINDDMKELQPPPITTETEKMDVIVVETTKTISNNNKDESTIKKEEEKQQIKSSAVVEKSTSTIALLSSSQKMEHSDAKNIIDDDDDDEEETTVQLQSEFHSVTSNNNNKPMEEQQINSKQENNAIMDVDDDDDLAAAIKKKKKKKKGKK